MIKQSFIYIICLLSLAACNTNNPVFQVTKKGMTFHVDKAWSAQEADSIFAIYDMQQLSFDSLMRYESLGRLENDGWYIAKNKKKSMQLRKPLLFNDWENDWSNYNYNNLWSTEKNSSENVYTNKIFGYNEWKIQSVFERGDTARFYLYEHKDAKSVFLSGTFNNWSTGNTPMKKDEKGWYADVLLKSGKHEYKFIIDGYWKRDLNNIQKVSDNCGDFNSVYFKTNYTFTFKEFTAKKIILAGSFNNWNEKDDKLINTKDSAYLSVFLPNGDYQYRFIVDGKWMSDPRNPNTVPNEFNELNSFISIGNKYFTSFTLNGYKNATKVVLSGSFNGWNEEELEMQKNNENWTISLHLRPGFHQYKFIVDGKWTLDLSGKVTESGVKGELDNWIIIAPNYTFTLHAFPDAKEVSVSGSFISWSEIGLKMDKRGDHWELPVYLDYGKTSYKFIVDGKWITDPNNTLIEENEYGTGNSVLWLKD